MESGRGFLYGWLKWLRQLIEDCAVLNHRGAKLFRRGLFLAEAIGNAVGEAIVFHHAGIGDRDIGGTLFESDLGIAARLEDCVDEVVGFGDGGSRVIDKSSLNGVPLGDKALPFNNAEVADFEGLDVGLAVGEFRLGLTLGTMADNGAVVF